MPTAKGPTDPWVLAPASPIIEIKRRWADAWEYEPQLDLIRATAAVSGHDLGTAELRRDYGTAKDPHEADLASRTAWNLLGWWVRASLTAGEGQVMTFWIGRITSEPREIYAAPDQPAGVQIWQAAEPLQELRKTPLVDSYWVEAGSERQIGWVPDFNIADPSAAVTGNRSAAPAANGVYLFGGVATWTRRQMLEYLLARHATHTGGPAWTTAGQVDLLEKLTDAVVASDHPTLAEVLGRIIDPAMGLDYTIIETPDGFAVWVYALSPYALAAGGVSLPANPQAVSLPADRRDLCDVNVVRSADQRHDRIRVIGKRLVVCCSLRGDADTLVPKWSAAQEAEYKAGTGSGSDDPESHDAARTADHLRAVWSAYGAPAAWNHQDGAAAPVPTPLGEILFGDLADYQTTARTTLTWLPLFAGIDYADGRAVDHNPSTYQPDLLGPLVWLTDPELDRYVPATERQIGIISPANDWGIQLRCQPAHLLANNHWDSGEPAETITEPTYDYSTLIATIAFEGDYRLELIHHLPDEADADGTCKVIDTPAELWLLAPNTVVGLAPDGQVKTSGPTGRVLRNDSQRMLATLAGAIGRYYQTRCRAEVAIEGLVNWYTLLGVILDVIETAGDAQTIRAPITSVSWTNTESQQRTVLRTGFAQ